MKMIGICPKGGFFIQTNVGVERGIIWGIIIHSTQNGEELIFIIVYI